MLSQFFLTSLTVQCTATLFLFLVFLILYRHSRQDYFAYWTAGWFTLGLGLLSLVFYFVRMEHPSSWILLAGYHASLGVTALLAFFARSAFIRGRRVRTRVWSLALPVCASVWVVARGFPGSEPIFNTPSHLFLAMALVASGSLFWRLAKEPKPGAGFLAVSFALWGLVQAHHALIGFFPEAPRWYLEWASLVETGVVTFVALGMILFALEEDRSRLKESNRKLEVSEQQLKDLAMRDPLTALFNRRHFDHVAPQLEAQAQRLGFPVAVFVIDLNRFKDTNDREGHQHGDQILRAVAEFLRQETRAADLTFRWGGDEFLLLMMDLSPEHAEIKAEQLRQRWQQVRSELGTEVTLAVGWAWLSDDGLEAAIRRADGRMYGDKRTQRNASATSSV